MKKLIPPAFLVTGNSVLVVNNGSPGLTFTKMLPGVMA